MKRNRTSHSLEPAHSFRARHVQRWLIGLILVIIVAGLRFPWLEADGGNSGFWSYGVFTTDEGYNTSSGRLAYLTGHFMDPELLDPIVFPWSWGLGLVNYLGYLVGGLSWGAARLPTMFAAVMGWFLAYWLASRTTLPALAGIVVLAVSSNPLSLTYERIHNTDVIVGCLVILSYIFVIQNSFWRAALAGAVLAFALSVKTTTVGLVPLVVLGMLALDKGRAKRLASFCVTFAIMFGALWMWRQACIDAARAFGSELLARMLVPIGDVMTFDPRIWLRALSVFPRWPISFQMGVFMIWVLLLPLWSLFYNCCWTRRCLTPRSAVCFGVLIYVGILATQAQAPLRRVALSVLFFVPLLLVQGRATMFRMTSAKMRRVAPVIATLLTMFALYWMPRHFLPDELKAYVYNDYILPAKSVWNLSWPVLGSSIIALIIALQRSAPLWNGTRKWVFVTGVTSSVTCLFFCNYALAIQGARGSFVGSQVILQISIALFILTLLIGYNVGRWRAWYVCVAVIYGGFALFDAHWREAYRELALARHIEREGAKELAIKLPANAIVVGRRSTTLLRQTRLRLGMVLPIWDPATFFADIERLLRRHPDQPLYVLLDSDPQTPPAVEYLKRNLDKFQFQHVATLQQYADGTPQLVPLYVLRVGLK